MSTVADLISVVLNMDFRTPSVSLATPSGIAPAGVLPAANRIAAWPVTLASPREVVP